MHRLTRFFLISAVVWLAASFVLKLAAELFGFDAGPVRFAAIHLLVVGWVTQVIIGVSIWMFPPARGKYPRSDSPAGWFIWFALNAGLLLRLVFEGLLPAASPVALAAGALLQGVSILVYVVLIFPRIRGVKPN